jgi:tungstate transport system substrate-binding protein
MRMKSRATCEGPERKSAKVAAAFRSLRTSRRVARVRTLCAGLAFVLALASAAQTTAESSPSLLLATTTSVRDSGLLDAILLDFTKQTGIQVRVIAVGTGAALRMGREGNADLLLTHAPSAEQVLVDDGIVRRRTPFMENHFVIAGPKEDPAGIAAAPTPEAALRAIASKQAGWVSRADDSGTYKREVSLWKSAGLSADAKWTGFLRTGSGMGQSLQVAGEKRAYILSDIGTFLAFEKRVDLVALSKPADSLRNVYSLLQLDASKFDHPLATESAEALERYFLAPSTLARIGEFGRDRYRRALFEPLASGSAGSEGAE